MEHDSHAGDLHYLPIILEIAPEDGHDPDPAAVHEAGQHLLADLQREGYILTPVYTGQRGDVTLLYQIITTLETVPASIWAHRDVVDTISALCTIFGTLCPLALRILKAHSNRSHAASPQKQPLKLTLVIDGAPLSVEARDLEEAEAALTLAQRFHSTHPAVASGVTPNSRVEIKERVPKRPPRRRR